MLYAVGLKVADCPTLSASQQCTVIRTAVSKLSSVRPLQDGTLILCPQIGCCSVATDTWKAVAGVNSLAWSEKVILWGGGSHTD